MILICKVCGKKFSANNPKRRSCSKQCSIIWKETHKRRIVDGKTICTKCHCEKNISEFYKNNRGDGPRYYCKQCDDALVLEQQKRRKRIFVELKGGKCQKCGYNKCIGALEFHHVNKEEKEFNINRNLSLEQMENELQKCILLCANCHREEHCE